MALPSNNSSTSSVTSNPNPRSSEIINPMRRSFSGNPFAKPSVIASPRSFLPNTPANSPSDFSRRNSFGSRESVGSLRHLDDKENGKDQILKQSKVRSQAASLKGTKNFMSSTISASSKINESPRKKVLIERNEPARTSIPSTDTKSPIRKVMFAEPLECGDLKPDVGVEEKKLEALLDGDGVPKEEELRSSSLTSENFSSETVHDVDVPLIPKNDTESSYETVNDELDCVNLGPTFKLSPTPTPPPVSSKSTIDVDPLILMPPYDPKTNYLSPRPQFLHYKPKPRMELCNERESEDSFISGIFSDTEVTEDTQSEGSQKESEDLSSDDIVKEEVGRVSEPSPARTSISEETVKAKEVLKPRFSMRSKAIALLLLLSVAFMSISVTNSPVIDHTVFEDFYEVYESSEISEFAKANFDQFSEFAKANFDGLARNFHTWLTKSFSSISELISNVRGVHNLAHLQYCNLTVLHDYIAADHYPIFGRGEKEVGDTPEVDPPVLIVQESDAASEIVTDEDTEDISAEHYDSVYEEQVQQDIEDISAEHYDSVYDEEQVQQDMGVITGVDNASDAPESEEVLEGQLAAVIESEQALQLAEAGNLEAEQAQGVDSEVAEINAEVYDDKTGDLKLTEAEEKSASIDEQQKNWPGLDTEVSKIHTEVYDDKKGEMQLTKAEDKSLSINAAIKENEQRLAAVDLPPRTVLYLLLCGGTVLIAGAAFNWSRKGKRRSIKVTSSVERPLFGKAIHVNSMPAPKGQTFLRNGAIEMDVFGESCPSEMSSFEKSSSNGKNVVKELNEAHSLEKKPKKNDRRESLASSSDYSMGSPSYGSVTVYEKITSKQGRGGNETITPVRRSNRIRNQATSPL